MPEKFETSKESALINLDKLITWCDAFDCFKLLDYIDKLPEEQKVEFGKKIADLRIKVIEETFSLTIPDYCCMVQGELTNIQERVWLLIIILTLKSTFDISNNKIAKECGTNPMRVGRLLKRYRQPLGEQY